MLLPPQIADDTNTPPSQIRAYASHGIIPNSLFIDGSIRRQRKYKEEAKEWVLFANLLRRNNELKSAQALGQIFQAALDKWGEPAEALHELKSIYYGAGETYESFIREIFTLELPISTGFYLRELVRAEPYYKFLRALEIPKGIEPQDIELQILLHLPRVTPRKRLPDRKTIFSEIFHANKIISSRTSKFQSYLEAPNSLPTAPNELFFTSIPEDQATIINTCFHYIGSTRQNSLHFGLETKDNKLAAMVSFSPFDLSHMSCGLPDDIEAKNVLVLSRGFAFGWAPPNKLSYLMAKVNDWIEKHHSHTKMLLTYVNPNLGFTGSVYRASNWVFFGEEIGTRYAYFNGCYVTDRELIVRFGTANYTILQSKLGTFFDSSRISLAPLQLFSYFLSSNTRKKFASGFKYQFVRPKD